jgi:hypothetical protein
MWFLNNQEKEALPQKMTTPTTTIKEKNEL